MSLSLCSTTASLEPALTCVLSRTAEVFSIVLLTAVAVLAPVFTEGAVIDAVFLLTFIVCVEASTPSLGLSDPTTSVCDDATLRCGRCCMETLLNGGHEREVCEAWWLTVGGGGGGGEGLAVLRGIR